MVKQCPDVTCLLGAGRGRAGARGPGALGGGNWKGVWRGRPSLGHRLARAAPGRAETPLFPGAIVQRQGEGPRGRGTGVSWEPGCHPGREVLLRSGRVCPGTCHSCWHPAPALSTRRGCPQGETPENLLPGRHLSPTLEAALRGLWAPGCVCGRCCWHTGAGPPPS